MSAPSSPPQHLYKILTPPLTVPAPLPAAHVFPTTPLDEKDGFVHLSTRVQVPYVLGKFFAGADQATVLLVRIDYAALCAGAGDVRWEQVGGGVFAHLYGADLVGGVVTDTRWVERGEGSWEAAVEGLQAEGWMRD